MLQTTALVIIAVALVVFREKISMTIIQQYDIVRRNVRQVHPISNSAEQFLVLAGSLAFFVARTKDLRKHSLLHKENLHLMYSALIGIGIGCLIDIEES
jgi:hypothetical protein